MKRVIATLIIIASCVVAAAAPGHSYVVLQGGKSFATQVSAAGRNATIVVRGNFNLGGRNVNLPEGCILKFEGGAISNGTLTGNGTVIEAGEYQIFDSNLKLAGKYNLTTFPAAWYGAIPNNSNIDLGAVLKTILTNLSAIAPRTEWSNGHGYGGTTITLGEGTFYDSSSIDFVNYSLTDLRIKGANKSGTVIQNRLRKDDYLFKNSTAKAPWGLEVSDITFIDGSAFSLITPYDVRIHDCKFYGNNYAILVYLTVNTHIDDCLFINTTYPITVSGNAGKGPSTTFYVGNCWMQHCDKGIMATSTSNDFDIYAHNTIIEYCNESIQLANNSSTNSRATFDHCYFEGNKSGTISNVATVFDNCFVDPTDGGFKYLKAAGSKMTWRGESAPKVVRQQNAGISITLNDGTVEDFVGRHHVVNSSSFPTARIEGKYARVRYTCDKGIYEGTISSGRSGFSEMQKMAGNLSIGSFSNGNLSFPSGSNPKIEVWY